MPNLPPSLATLLPLSLPRSGMFLGEWMTETGLQKLAFVLLLILIVFVSAAGGV